GNHEVRRMVEAYDPSTDVWTTNPPLPTARGELAAAVVDGTLYAVGGANDESFLTTVEAYDPIANSWTTKASMSTARVGLAAAAVSGGLYAVGGVDGSSYERAATLEAYEPAT